VVIDFILIYALPCDHLGNFQRLAHNDALYLDDLGLDELLVDVHLVVQRDQVHLDAAQLLQR
jgi:hypothetical protein